MYVFAIIGLLYCLGLCFSVILQAPGSRGMMNTTKKLPMFGPGIAGFITHLAMQVLLVAGLEVGILTVVSVFAFLAVLSFGCPAMYMASAGDTIIERQFPMKEYVQIKPQVYCPLGPGFYQRSRRENLRVILGPRWWLRLLLPTRGGALDLQPALCPTPGDPGLHALKERVSQVEKDGVQNTVSSCQQLGFNPGPAEAKKDGEV
jgi:hypothetical protein